MWISIGCSIVPTTHIVSLSTVMSVVIVTDLLLWCFPIALMVRVVLKLSFRDS
jgi:hypothetical protein